MFKLSAETEYAYVALLKLAADQKTKATTKLMEIVAEKRLSEKFMLQVLTDLRRAGLVLSRRGKSGGYTLACPAEEITLGDVLRATSGGTQRRNGVFRIAGQNNYLAASWHSILTEMGSMAERFSLAEALAAERKASEPMYYI